MTLKISPKCSAVKSAMLNAVCGVILLGCSNSKLEQKVATSDEITPLAPIKIMPFFDNGEYPEIDSRNLPKIGINTPSGIRYIPDQTKNPMLIKAMETMDAIRIKYKKTDPNYHYRKEWLEAAYLSTRIVNTHYHDIIRLGCQDYVDAMCRESGLRYLSDCGSEHNFGRSGQSECEKKSIQSTPVNLVHRPSCSINGSVHRPEISVQYSLPISERIKNSMLFECRRWRD